MTRAASQGDGERQVLPAGDIEERVRQNISVMPGGQIDEISLEDFAALVDYLESLKDVPGQP